MTHPLLHISNLKTWYPVRQGVLARTIGHVRAVDGVSLDVFPGETVGLVGESGCGKSTLVRTVMGLETPTSGAIRLDGIPLWPAHHRDALPLRRRLQMIFQDPYASLNPRMTILDIVTEGLLEHGLIRSGEQQASAVSLLAEVGMESSALHRYPHEFSGGQRQRISIARAMALRPDLVICDEAVSALDVSVRAQVLNLLMDLRTSHKLAYLFIAHDLGVIRHIAHRVAVMYLGTLVETGPAAAVLDRPAHPYTQALISAIPMPYRDRQQRIVLAGDVPSAAHPPSGCRFRTRCPHAIEQCALASPPLDPFGIPTDRRTVACFRANELQPTSTQPRTGCLYTHPPAL
jgi:oligopeptide/dipeptide ABC transporter ATP-binding protein